MQPFRHLSNPTPMWWLTFALCLFQGSCGRGIVDPPPSADDPLKVTIRQGVAGRVWFLQGDYFSGGPITATPVKRPILVYTPTKWDSVVRVGYSAFYSRILSTFVGETISNDSGFFQLSLPVGHYSIFVQEDTLFYSNSFDGEGYIQPVAVSTDSVTSTNVNITYQTDY